MTKPYTKTSKRFLNDSYDEHGAVSWNVGEGYSETKRTECKTSELRLQDCYKVITIEFGYIGREEYEQRLAKLDTLIEELQAFRVALGESWGKV